MSFLRPGAETSIRRWAETVVAGGAMAALGWQGTAWVLGGAPVGWILLAGAAIMALWLRSALAGSLARPKGPGPGLVVLREGEVGYMGPHEGGFVPVDMIERVEIVAPTRGGRLWLIDAGDAGTIVIPAEAEGAGRLVEALAVLPHFSDLAVARTLQAPGAGRRVVWQRERPAGLPRG